MTDELTAVGMYVFAGLFTQGVKDAGVRVLADFEDGDFGVGTHRLNFPEVPVYEDRAEWESAFEPYQGTDIVYGNPACAGFSVTNSSRGADYRSNCQMKDMAAVALLLQPRAFLLESVCGLMRDGDELVRGWEREWRKAGYNTCRLFENGGHLGLPQNRKRCMFVAAKANIDFRCHHGEPTTVGEAIADLSAAIAPWLGEADGHFLEPMPVPYPGPALSEYQVWARGNSEMLTWHAAKIPSRKMRGLLPFVKEGGFRHLPYEVYEQHYWPHGKNPDLRGLPSILEVRQRWDKHCSTVMGGAKYYHPEHDRYMTVREQARLMGVRDSFVFDPLGAPYAELGKAVSPIVGRWAASQLAEMLADPRGRRHQDTVNLITRK